MSLDENLSQQSYKIVDELKIRKQLEKGTDWSFEFTKAPKYDYDLELHRWPDNSDSPEDRELLGYIEVERADNKEYSWITGDPPDNWVYYSFLKRKVYEYDYDLRRWDGLKDNYRRTLYLKFNHAMDNSFIAPIAAIYRDGETTKRSDGSPTNTYLKLDFEHPDVHLGIDETVGFINDYLSAIDKDQRGLEAYAEAET